MRPPLARKSGGGLSSFTLVELLVVMFIIAILVAIVLAAAQGVMTSAARSRAKAEIQAVATNLENYKTDNATYPLTNTIAGGPANYSTLDGTSLNYQEASQLLYEVLSGKTNFEDTPVAGAKYYMSFKASQLGNTKTAAGTAIGPTSTYLADPFGFSYGYNTGDVPVPPTTTQQYPPNNGTGFFDFWSTGGVTASELAANPSLTNSWISNWTGQ